MWNSIFGMILLWLLVMVKWKNFRNFKTYMNNKCIIFLILTLQPWDIQLLSCVLLIEVSMHFMPFFMSQHFRFLFKYTQALSYWHSNLLLTSRSTEWEIIDCLIGGLANICYPIYKWLFWIFQYLWLAFLLKSIILKIMCIL